MTHLYIEQNVGLTEEADIKVIEKLYDIVTNNTLDVTSDLKGRLHSTIGYKHQVNHLNTTYPDLYISVDDYAIPFEDPNMLQYLLNLGIGSNGYITETQAAAATTVVNSENTTITKFNELKYFTNITSSKGGFSGTNSGVCRFYKWTALQEVDISNFISLGHNNGSAYDDTFSDCSSLRTVVASDKLTQIGYNSFKNCCNLKTITGLSGTIEVWDNAFSNCSKLPQSFFQPLHFLLKFSSPGGNFSNCTLLTSIDIADGTISIPKNCFYKCTNLASVTIPNSVTIFNNSCFEYCTSLTGINIPNGSVTTIKGKAFNQCSGLTTLTLPTTVTSIEEYSFQSCTNLTTVTGLSNVTTTGTGAFNGCSNLTSVDLTTSGTFAPNLFESCVNLTTIGSWVNNTVTITPNSSQFRTFYNCQKLEFPEELTVEFQSDTSRGRDVGANCFNNCKKLKKVILSGTNLNLGIDIFRSSGLTQIQGTENIKYIGNNIFYGTNISGTLNLINCIGPGSRADGSQRPDFHCLLGNVSGITKVILGDWDTSFKKSEWNLQGEYRSFFDNCSGLTTVDFKSMYDFPNIRRTNLIESGLFYRCPNMTTFIIRQESVVPLQIDDIVHSNDIGGPNVTLYVPDSVVNDYKTATGWSNIASQIKGLSELPS